MSHRKYIFLDDERYPIDVTWIKLPDYKWDIIRNYPEFVKYIQTHGVPEFLSLDHDLGSEHYGNFSMNESGYFIDYSKFSEKTGYDCAKFLVDECIRLDKDVPDYVVHSMNPIGKQNIISYLESYKNARKK